MKPANVKLKLHFKEIQTQKDRDFYLRHSKSTAD